MEQFISKIGYYPKYSEVVEYTLKLINENIDTIDEHNQLALQWADEPTWENCQGKEKAFREAEFNKIMPQIKDSPIEDFLNSLPMRTFRSRIFIVRPSGNGYSVHKDPSARLHLPIYTNKECYFLTSDNLNEDLHRETLLEADGSIYTVDTKRYHTFCNNGDDWRIHIVCGID